MTDFDSFYRAEFPAMVALARAISGAESAEDIAQEAMTRAHRRWSTISGYELPGAWLRRVTINLAISRRRRVTRELSALRRKAFERRVDESQAVGRDHEVWEAVRRLPPRQRAAIALFYQDGYSTRDIAEILDCSISAATSNLNHARTRLARELGESAIDVRDEVDDVTTHANTDGSAL